MTKKSWRSRQSQRKQVFFLVSRLVVLLFTFRELYLVFPAQMSFITEDEENYTPAQLFQDVREAVAEASLVTKKYKY